MTSTVLILGAAGRIGQALAHAFADAGWTVRAQSRKDLPASLAARPGVRPVRCDALDAAALRRAAEGAQVVVHALNPLYTRAEWDRLVLPLADAAIEAAAHAGALLMLPGNVYNFGRELPPTLTTRTPEVANTAKARVRIEAEARMAARAGLHSVVIRAGDFFGGDGRGTWLDQAMAKDLARGRFVYPGPRDIEHAWAFLPDLAQCFVRVAERRDAWRGALRLHFAGHTVTGDELHRAMEAVAGRALRVRSFPWWLLRLASPFQPVLRELVAMRYLWNHPHRLDDSELRALIGEPPQTPLAQALASALRAHELLPVPDRAPVARAV